MKKIIFLVGLFITISFSDSNAQKYLIRITETQIITPDTIVLDTMDLEDNSVRTIKIIIKNERKNSVEIKNIKTPPGSGASIKNSVLKPKSQTELYIGFSAQWMDTKGQFIAPVTLETNLIKNINLTIKGFIKE